MNIFSLFRLVSSNPSGSSPTPPGPTPTTGEYQACVARASQMALVGDYYLVSGSSGNVDGVWYNADKTKYLYNFNGTWCVSGSTEDYPGIADAIIDTRLFPNDWSGVSDTNYYYGFTYHAS